MQRHDLYEALHVHVPYYCTGASTSPAPSDRQDLCLCLFLCLQPYRPRLVLDCVTADAAKQVTILCSDEVATDAVPAFDHVPSPPLSRPAEPTPLSSPPRVRHCYGPMALWVLPPPAHQPVHGAGSRVDLSGPQYFLTRCVRCMRTLTSLDLIFRSASASQWTAI